MVTDESQWYVQKGSRVQGPFSTNEVGRFLLLGRVRNTDRVSRDGELWEPVTQVPELIPEELLNLQSDEGWNKFLTVRATEDDRQLEVPVEQDRRLYPDPLPQKLRDEWQAVPPQPISQSVLPWSLLGITLAALGVVLYLNAVTGTTG
ncbi:MAG: DUF4339 domain-containing protein [Granulosicoccus sp.]|nr:DUF4339 domain-containing protein [Granulosicoccus sp.]